MTGRNWDKARTLDRARKGEALATEFHEKRPPRANKTPFPQVYARYANAQRAQGRKPLPPKQWIAALKQRRPAHP